MATNTLSPKSFQKTPGILYVIRCLDIRGIARALCGERGMSCYRRDVAYEIVDVDSSYYA
jgi:hypothetical protein